MKFKPRTALSYKVGSASFEKVDQKSKAIPNEAYTARELYDKYVKGQPLPTIAAQEAWYDQDEDTGIDLEKIKNLDVLEQGEVLAFLGDRKKEIEEKLQKKRELEIKKAQDDYDAKIADYLARQKVQKEPESKD